MVGECISSERRSIVRIGGIVQTRDGGTTSSEEIIDVVAQDMVLFVLVSMLLELALCSGKGSLEPISSGSFVRVFMRGIIGLVVLVHRLDYTMPWGAWSGWKEKERRIGERAGHPGECRAG